MDEPIVRISNGFLRGTTKETLDGKQFYSFEGIPFAEPPIGLLRFKAPVPVKSWEGVRDATSKKLPSLSFDKFSPPPENVSEDKKGPPITGSEDCLYLNVFTPTIPHDKYDLKPVFVFIHGGAFVGGGTQMYGPEVLESEDVVLVTISYRLGALGFLAIDEPELGVTGNAAMKDMVLGLKWIQRNIRNFNGDPNNVTLTGESAGAAATHWLILSPTTKGLFHKAILQSGSTLCVWSRGNRQNGTELAKALGCDATDNEEILQFLQALPAEEVLRGQEMLPNAHNYVPSVVRDFAPIVEHSDAKDAFMKKDPMDVLLSGRYQQIPLMFGFNNEEGGLFALQVFKPQSSQTAESSVVPFWMNLEVGSEEYIEVARKIRKFYLKDQSDQTEDDPSSQPVMKLAGDDNFVRPIMQSAKLHSMVNEEPIYLYRLSIATKLASLTGGKTKGVCHGDELGYLYHMPGAVKVEPESIEDITRKRIVKFFTNFAKTGNPNQTNISLLFPVTWEAMENGEIKLMDINKKLSMKTNPEKEMMQFWDSVFQSSEHSKHF